MTAASPSTPSGLPSSWLLLAAPSDLPTPRPCSPSARSTTSCPSSMRSSQPRSTPSTSTTSNSSSTTSQTAHPDSEGAPRAANHQHAYGVDDADSTRSSRGSLQPSTDGSLFASGRVQIAQSFELLSQLLGNLCPASLRTDRCLDTVTELPRQVLDNQREVLGDV